MTNRFDNVKLFIKVRLLLASDERTTWNFETVNRDQNIKKLAIQKKGKTI